MFRSPLILAALAICASGAAQTSASPSVPLAKVRELHAEWVRVRAQVDDAARELKDAPRESELFRQASQRVQELTRQAAAPQQAFQHAFATSEWAKFDVAKDAALLQDGLPVLARDFARPQAAVAAGRFFLANFAADGRAPSVAGHALPLALLATGDARGARAALDRAIDQAKGNAKAKLLVTLGDIEAADGDLQQATRCYELADAAVEGKDRRAITIRRALLGQPAASIDSKVWFGAAPRPLAAMRGKVLLIDFFASWCPPCRTLMPSLNELFLAEREAGLEVVGVTRVYANGYLPATRAQLSIGGGSLENLDETKYREHLARFRKNVGIDYPFVLATEQDFRKYQISSIPTVILVGRDGKVALVMMGASCEPVLRYAVSKALAAGKR